MASENRPKRQSYQGRTKRESAQLSKFLNDELTPKSYDNQGNRRPETPPLSFLQQVSQRTASVSQDLESMKQLLPDIELAAQILVSSILSPKDMGTPDLAFRYNSNFSQQVDIEEEELGGKLIEVIHDYFTDEYNINNELSDILYDILFEKGAYVRMIVPESSIDSLINEQGRLTFESLRPSVNPSTMAMRPLGIIGDRTPSSSDDQKGEERVSFENFGVAPTQTSQESYQSVHEYIHVVDNPDAVKMTKVFDKLRKDHVKKRYSTHFSQEKRRANAQKKEAKPNEGQAPQTVSVKGLSDRDIERTLKDRRKFAAEPVTSVRTKSQVNRDSYGHPMVMELSSEAVIPAHAPSSPKNHLGYFILLDQYGYPISTSAATDHYRELQDNFRGGGGNDAVKRVMNELQGNQTAATGRTHTEDVSQATNAFANIVERDLLERLRKGPGFEVAELERPNEIYQIMMARALKKKHTQILFVPQELVSYMAFYFTKQGVGKSLLESTRVLGSIRVLLMFANTMASVRNASTKTDVKVQLDPNDSDPMSTVDMVKNSIIRSRSEQYPLGESDPSAMVDFLQKAGVSVTYSGHDALPEMDVDIRNESGDKATIDRDLEERLRHTHIMSMGISPETVDVSRGVDFATSIVNSSLLLNKRVAIYQRKLEEQKADFVQKYVRNSETLCTQLLEIINSDEKGAKNRDPNEAEKILEAFIDSIEVSLPRPDTITMESQMEAFEQYSRGLEDAIEYWVNDEFIQTDLHEQLGDRVREFKEAVKSYYMRRWMRENNIFPELEEFTDRDNDDQLTMAFGEIQGSHVKGLFEQLENYLHETKKEAAERQQRITENEEQLQKEYNYEPDESAGGSKPADDSSGGSDDLGGGIGDDDGFGDFSL